MGPAGLACWDSDRNGEASPEEDRNGDGLWNAEDCVTQGLSGLNCWDVDGDGVADVVEDVNNDGEYTAEDCEGPIGVRGPMGLEGVQGNTGARGATGPSGPDGRPGIEGPPGAGVELAGLHILDTLTIHSAVVDSGDRIFLRGTLDIHGTVRSLDYPQLIVSGGIVDGNGTGTLDINRGATVSGTVFRDVVIDGYDTVFINCDFEGAVTLPSDARVVGGHFTSAVVSPMTRVGVVDGAELRDSTLSRVTRVVDSLIMDSTIGAQQTNTGGLLEFRGNRANDSVIYLGRNGRVVSNYFEHSILRIEASNFGNGMVTSNLFDRQLEGESVLLRVDTTSGQSGALMISNNTFYGLSSLAASIHVVGTPSGSYQMVHISDNVFQRGDVAIQYNSLLTAVIRDNTTHATTLGVTDGWHTVTGNIHFQ